MTSCSRSLKPTITCMSSGTIGIWIWGQLFHISSPPRLAACVFCWQRKKCLETLKIGSKQQIKENYIPRIFNMFKWQYVLHRCVPLVEMLKTHIWNIKFGVWIEKIRFREILLGADNAYVWVGTSNPMNTKVKGLTPRTLPESKSTRIQTKFFQTHGKLVD